MDVDPYAGTTANGELVDTEFCRIDGMGTLTSGDSFLGGVEQIDAAGGLTGEIYFYGPETENPDCDVEPEPPEDDHGCHWGRRGEGHGHTRHGGGHFWSWLEGALDHGNKNGGHNGWSRGRGHHEHGNGHGRGHRNHDHGDPAPDPVCEPLQDAIVLHPEALRCRINGLTLGDVDGMATINDVDGYFFSLSMQAFDDPVADYVALRIWAPNPDYVPGGTESEWVLDREIIDELSSGQVDIALP